MSDHVGPMLNQDMAVLHLVSHGLAFSSSHFVSSRFHGSKEVLAGPTRPQCDCSYWSVVHSILCCTGKNGEFRKTHLRSNTSQEICTWFLYSFVLLSFGTCSFYPYPSGSLHWQCQWSNPEGYVGIILINLQCAGNVITAKQIMTKYVYIYGTYCICNKVQIYNHKSQLKDPFM